MIKVDDETIYIAGLGAMGSVMAGHLHQKKIPVRLLLKNSEQLNKYEGHGLSLCTSGTQYKCSPTASDINHLKLDKIKYVLLCVKSYDVINVVTLLEGHLAHDHIVIMLCNGVGIFQKLKQLFPRLKIILLVSYISAQQDNKFTTNYRVIETSYIGPLTNSNTSLNSEDIFIKNTFEKLDIPVTWTNDISSTMWRKFTINCTINILTAIHQCSCAELLNLHLPLVKNLTKENVAILQQSGINISAEEMLDTLIFTLKGISNGYVSAYRDAKKGGQTEIPYLNGYLIQLAKLSQYPAKINLELLDKLAMKL